VNWTLEELEPEIDSIRARINQHRRLLNEYFVNRQDEIDLAVTCAAAQEPLLFVGVPGTGKSDLVVKFVESLGLGEDDYFEYMLTKFTEPSEILGPIDIDLLKQGRFVRRTKGKLPEAKVAFIDEIFKSNSAILNTLLTIVNERKYYQDGEPTPVALKMLFAATNEIPEQSELDALADRFVVKVETKPVKDTHFSALIDAGIMNEVYRATEQKPWRRGTASFEDYMKFKRYMDLSFGARGSGSADREAWFPPAVFAEMRRIVRTLDDGEPCASALAGASVHRDAPRSVRWMGHQRPRRALAAVGASANRRMRGGASVGAIIQTGRPLGDCTLRTASERLGAHGLARGQQVRAQRRCCRADGGLEDSTQSERGSGRCGRSGSVSSGRIRRDLDEGRVRKPGALGGCLRRRRRARRNRSVRRALRRKRTLVLHA
jgi:MoxR-like ATPase